MQILRQLIWCVLCATLYYTTAFSQLTALPFGKLDREFGDNGSLIVPTGGGIFFFGDSILLADGKIAWVNTFQDQAGHFRIAVSKLLTSGLPDPSFGNNGSAYFSFGVNNIGISIATLPNGSLIVAGRTSATSDLAKDDFLVFRLTSNGEIDTSFGTDGSFIKDFAEPNSTEFSDDGASSLVLVPDGKILVGGVSNRYGSFSGRGNTSSTLIRLNASGSVDDTFGQNGISQLFIGNDPVGSSLANHQVVLSTYSDGKILAGLNADRQTTTGYNGQGEVVRFQENGALDTKFAQNGRLLLTFPNSFTACSGLKILPSGNILVLMPYALISLNTNGAFDPAFGNAGTQLLGSFAGDFLIQDDQKILISGSDFISFAPLPGGRQIGRVLRTFSNGLPDLRFGILGKTLVTYRGGPSPFRDPNIGLGRIHLVDSKHIIVTGGYNVGTNYGNMMLTKIVVSK